jgi:hypothetical protein
MLCEMHAYYGFPIKWTNPISTVTLTMQNRGINTNCPLGYNRLRQCHPKESKISTMKLTIYLKLFILIVVANVWVCTADSVSC